MADDEDYRPEPIDIEQDSFIAFIEARNREDGDRASSAGSSRQKIGEFIDETGINGQALSWCRSIMKKRKFSQKMDIIRSLEEALPMVRAHLMGGQGDLFDGEKPEPPAGHNSKPSYPENFDPAAGDSAPEPAPKRSRKKAEPAQAQAPEIASDVDDFEAHLAQVQEAAE